MPQHRPAVVLLSGGLDSATVLAIARSQGYTPLPMSFRYGQKHAAELQAAQRLVAAAGLPRHWIIDIDLAQFGGSALTDTQLQVPKHRSEEQIGQGVPITYVPARNTIFLSFALALAETSQANDIFLGVNALDYSGYPDCRPEFIAAFQDLAKLATRAGTEQQQPLTIHAPLIQWTKAEIIRRGLELGVDYSLTISCYDPTADGLACGSCDACLLRKKGFAECGVADPTRYAP